MTESESWARLEAVFLQAIELPTEERAAFLDTACGDDQPFRREVEAVLAGHAAAGGSHAPDRLLPSVTPPATTQLSPGDRLGPWQIDALVGRGGMGEVYRAHRADAQYEQEVAIKVLRAGRDTNHMLQRFRSERQILARLQHPNIATLIDGGVTEAGQPWLAMQYVDGRPITEWADAKGLGVRERLQTAVTVCEAVNVAHANLVVHRDLKPSNILVTDDGTLRLLDFGIAKVLDTDDPLTGDLLLLTPEHAAPEQFKGEPVTTATDVYALGVLLYQLLTGTRPFQFTAPAELMRAVCEESPVPPSVAASDASRLGKAGRPAPPVRPETIAGDLDAIVLMALRKEPERRYRTVGDLAADLRRFLGGFPVEARPDSFVYVASRFVRRNRAASGAAALAIVALLSLVGVSLRSASRSREQAAAIARERDVAVQVSTFLEGLFKTTSPYLAGTERRDTMRLRDFLTEATAKVEAELSPQPLVQAQMLTVLGRAHLDMGLNRQGERILNRAVAIRRAQLGPDAMETASSERSLAHAIAASGNYAAAESILRRVEATLARDSIGHRDDRIRALSGLGSAIAQQGRYAQAETVYRRALRLAEQEYDSQSSELAGRISDVGTTLTFLARYAEAETLLKQSLAIERVANGKDGPRIALPLNNLASNLMRQGRAADAEPFMREALQLVDAALPDGHPFRASALANLGANLTLQKRSAEGEDVLRRALDLQRRVHGDKHPALGGTMTNLASAIDDQGRHADALRIHREAAALWAAALGPKHPQVAFALNNQGVSLQKMGRHGEAVPLYQEAFAIRKASLGPAHPLTLNVQGKIGQSLTEVGRHAEALPHLEAAVAGMLRDPKADTAMLGRFRRLRDQTAAKLK
jgi:serine/threonine-protein kinase